MSEVLEKLQNNDPSEAPISVSLILWVDDDPHLAAGFERRLRRYGIRLIHAYDGMQGYWMAASQKPDVVITDLKMPKWPGQDLVECLSLNRELAGIPTFVVSGHIEASNRKRLRELGVTAVLEKPLGIEDLLAELRNLTERQ
ncbi:MAG: response regulator [Planctomycetota bacterium]